MAPTLLFCTQTAHTWGGVERWLTYLVPGLEANGWRVIVGLARGRRFNDPDRYRAANPYAETVELSAVTGTTEGRLRAICRAVARVAPDIVVPLGVADALPAARRFRARGPMVRLLYPVHGLSGDLFADAGQFADVIDAAAGTTRLAAAGLRSAGLPDERVFYAPGGVAAPRRPPSFDPPTGRLRLAYVGRLTQVHKRVLDLVPFCAELARLGVPFLLDVVGSGDAERELRQLLAPYVHDGRVRFHGFLTQQALYERIYPDLPVLVLCSDSETGPLAGWEAMAHGATVVTTSYLGLRTENALVHDVNALTAPVGDMARLAAHVRDLAADQARLDRLRRTAWDTARERYTLSRSVASWHDAFDRCLALPPIEPRPALPQTRARGRLDRALGPAWAETIRAYLGLGMTHEEPGGEWPHTLSLHSSDGEAMLRQLAVLDAA